MGIGRYINPLTVIVLQTTCGLSAASAETSSTQILQRTVDDGLRLQTKTLVDNERVQVLEERLAPGAESESVTRPYRVVRVLEGGKLQRIFPDGRRDEIVWKSGEVRVAMASAPYILKNVGDGEVVLYTVRLKN